MMAIWCVSVRVCDCVMVNSILIRPKLVVVVVEAIRSSIILSCSKYPDELSQNRFEAQYTLCVHVYSCIHKNRHEHKQHNVTRCGLRALQVWKICQYKSTNYKQQQYFVYIYIPKINKTHSNTHTAYTVIIYSI